MYFKLTYDIELRTGVKTRSKIVEEFRVEQETQLLLAKGAFNFESELDENIDEQVEREINALLGA